MTGRAAVVWIDVRTSMLNCTFPFSFADQGSDLANQEQARRELETFLRQALQALSGS
jgi:hypothetical protein